MFVSSAAQNYLNTGREIYFKQDFYKERAITCLAVAVVSAAGTFYVANYLVAVPVVILSGVALGVAATSISLIAGAVNWYWHKSMGGQKSIETPYRTSVVLVTRVPATCPSKEAVEKSIELTRLANEVKDPNRKEELRQSYLKDASSKGLHEANKFLKEYKKLLSLTPEEISKAVWDVEKETIDLVDLGTYLARNGYLAFPEEPYIIVLKTRFESYVSRISSLGFKDKMVRDFALFANKLGIEKKQFNLLFFAESIAKLQTGEWGFAELASRHGVEGIRILAGLGYAGGLVNSALKEPEMGLSQCVEYGLYSAERRQEILEAQLNHLDNEKRSVKEYLSQNEQVYLNDSRLQKALLKLSFGEVVAYKEHWKEMGITSQDLSALVGSDLSQKGISQFLKDQKNVEAFDYLPRDQKLLYRAQFMKEFEVPCMKEFTEFKAKIERVLEDVKWLEGGCCPKRSAFMERCALSIPDKEWVQFLSQMEMQSVARAFLDLRNQYVELNARFTSKTARAQEDISQGLQSVVGAFESAKDELEKMFTVSCLEEKSHFEMHPEVSGYITAEADLNRINEALASLGRSNETHLEQILAQDKEAITQKTKELELLLSAVETRSSRKQEKSDLITRLRAEKTSSDTTPIQGVRSAWTAWSSSRALGLRIVSAEKDLKQIDEEANTIELLEKEIPALEEKIRRTTQELELSTAKRLQEQGVLHQEKEHATLAKSIAYPSYLGKLKNLEQRLLSKKLDRDRKISLLENMQERAVAKKMADVGVECKGIEALYNEELSAFQVKWNAFSLEYKSLFVNLA